MKLWHAWVGLSILCVSACSPGLDWREVKADGGLVMALFPCKPEVINRAPMGLAQCKAEGLSFALSWAEVTDPAQVEPALRQMRESLAGKLSAVPPAPQALHVPGMTPNPQALSQHLPGPTQQAQVAVFSRGLRVYQAVMLGTKRNDAAWDAFLGSLKFTGQ
jgi:hypothetical protein